MLYYFFIINVLTFFAFGIDKRRAKKKQWRIPERTLFLLAFAGGSIGALLGMYTFRHKTKHLQFVIGIPVILFLQAGIYIFWKI